MVKPRDFVKCSMEDCQSPSRSLGKCKKHYGDDYRNKTRVTKNEKASEYREANRSILAEKSRNYHHANREEVLLKMRGYALKHEYGLSYNQYLKILIAQGEVCKLCGRPPGTKGLSVDHDHITGKIRGLLCPPCNTALGRLGDNVQGLLKVIDYLNNSEKEIKKILPDGPEYEPKSKRYVLEIL